MKEVVVFTRVVAGSLFICPLLLQYLFLRTVIPSASVTLHFILLYIMGYC